MWKFEVTKEDGTKGLHILEQSIDSDVARLMPEVVGASREDIRVFILERNAYLEGKELLSDPAKYAYEHLENGDCIIKLRSDNAMVLTVVAQEKQWDELYELDEKGNEVYLIPQDEVE